MAQMLLFEIDQTTNYADPCWRRIKGMIAEVRQWRPYDVVVFKLQGQIDEIISHKQPDSPIQERLRVYLGSFLENIYACCNRMTEKAIPLVEPNDVLFLYGYSLNIVKFLQAIKRSHIVYVVDTRPSTAHQQFEPHEDEQVLAFLKGNGFDGHYINLNKLSQVLKDLHRTKTPRKILLGTHSVVRMENGDRFLLCTEGEQRALPGWQRWGAQILAFAETNKFIDLKEEEVESVVAQGFSYDQMRGSARAAGKAASATTQMDAITKSLIDYLITENGICTQ